MTFQFLALRLEIKSFSLIYLIIYLFNIFIFPPDRYLVFATEKREEPLVLT